MTAGGRRGRDGEGHGGPGGGPGAGLPAGGREQAAHRWAPPAGDGPAVVCLGETMAALAPPPGTALAAAQSLGLDVAGAESNVAMYLADLGVPARWVSAVGDDPLGERVRARVAAAGVDVSPVRVDPGRPTGLMVKDPGPAGTRVYYHRRGSAASGLGPDALAPDVLAGARLLHLSGITPALSPSCRALVESALTPATTRTHATSFDVNHRPALWRGSAPEVLRGLADRADVVLVGLDEAQGLWGTGPAGDPAAVRALLPSPRVLVVKDGPLGATAFYDDEPFHVPALHVDVVEPVGAGDAFAAGFLSGLLDDAHPVHALRLGHLTAASALRVTGDHGPLLPAALRDELLTADDATWAARL